MNQHVGESSRSLEPEFYYFKPDDFTVPGPAVTWVILDEHEDSINDGYYLIGHIDEASWDSVPASRHSRGCNLVFADGHAERHRWQDPRTVQPVTRSPLFGPLQPGNFDVKW